MNAALWSFKNSQAAEALPNFLQLLLFHHSNIQFFTALALSS